MLGPVDVLADARGLQQGGLLDKPEPSVNHADNEATDGDQNNQHKNSGPHDTRATEYPLLRHWCGSNLPTDLT